MPFRDKAALELDRLGVAVVGRAGEAERLRWVLKGVDSGLLPKLIGVYGPPGSGKTFVVRRVCGEFVEASAGRLRWVYVNLGEGRTVFGCANRLLVAVGGLSRTGRVGLDGVMDGFWARVLEWRSGQRRFLLVVLDEADRLFMDERGDPSGFLYRFVRSQDRLEGSGIGLSLLTISNSPIWENWELDARVRSSMGVEELFFPPYDQETLKEILRQRGAEAYKPGAVSDEVIEECARYAAEQHRDVRRMVDMFRVCGEVAEKDGAVRVEMKHFKEALDRFEMDHYNTLLSGLAETQKDILYALALLSETRGVKVASTSQIHEYHQETLKGPALSHRRVLGLLKELEVLNLVGTRNISKGRGGRSNEVWLRIPPLAILDCFRPDLKGHGKIYGKIKGILQGLDELEERISSGPARRRRRSPRA